MSSEPPVDWQSQISQEPPAERGDVHVGDPVPTPAQLNAASAYPAQGAAVSGQPTDEHPGDRERARERIEWDAATDPTSAQDHDGQR